MVCRLVNHGTFVVFNCTFCEAPLRLFVQLIQQKRGVQAYTYLSIRCVCVSTCVCVCVILFGVVVFYFVSTFFTLNLMCENDAKKRKSLIVSSMDLNFKSNFILAISKRYQIGAFFRFTTSLNESL